MLLGGHMCMFCGVLSTVGEHIVTGVQYMPSYWSFTENTSFKGQLGLYIYIVQKKCFFLLTAFV
jgi:hypothetical protein